MARNSISLGRIRGIPILLDYSWFLIFILFTWLLATSYFPVEFRNWPAGMYWVLGAATVIMLFVSVLLHELGHSLVSMRYRIPVRSITLFLFGGVSQIEAESPNAAAEFFIAIIGPLVSVALAGIFYLLEQAAIGSQYLFGLFQYLVYINIALAIFNLIPGYPLDGGRVFRAAVWGITHNMRRSTIIAAGVGRFFGFLFIFLGVMQVFAGNLAGGIWIAFIGWFLESAAASQATQVKIQDLLAGHRVSEVMGANCATINQDLTLQQMVDSHFLGTGQRCFLVGDGGDYRGIVTLHQIQATPREKWQDTHAGEVMIPLDKMKYTTPETELIAAIQEMDRDGVNQLPVFRDHILVGMLTREDVISYLRRLQEIGM